MFTPKGSIAERPCSQPPVVLEAAAEEKSESAADSDALDTQAWPGRSLSNGVAVDEYEALRLMLTLGSSKGEVLR